MSGNDARLAARVEELESKFESALERIEELESLGTTIAEMFCVIQKAIALHDQFILRFDLEAEAAAFARQIEQEEKQ